jgi:hypothetical protein
MQPQQNMIMHFAASFRFAQFSSSYRPLCAIQPKIQDKQNLAASR